MIEFTEAEKAKIRAALVNLPVGGPLDALREHVALCDSILKKLEAADVPKGELSGNHSA